MSEAKRKLAAILAADVVGYSRLMGDDERATMDTLDAYRDVFRKTVSDHEGRVVDTAGDSVLAVFDSVVEAVEAAVAIQCDLAKRNEALADQRRMLFRVGVNLGDIIVRHDGTVYGDGVNVGARLEALCTPGGLCISRTAHDQVVDKLPYSFADLGEHSVKNIKRPVRAFALALGSIENSLAETSPMERTVDDDIASTASRNDVLHQEIRFCIARDGTQIAYSTVGSGPPLVKAPNWMTHLEFEWQSPIWRHFLEELSSDHTLVRFDQRANGLSDWDVENISLDDFVSDLETVTDTLKFDQFPLLGISQGCAISIAYAVRHPERVKCLILYGGFARGSYKRGPAAKEEAEAMMTLIRLGWGQDNPAFRQMFTSQFVPEGTREQMEWFNELQRVSISPENAVRIREAVCNFDVMDLLPRVSCPTLVLHCRGDGIAPFNEGKRMAAGIPNAQFAPLEGNNHLILEEEPCWTFFLQEVRSFLERNF